MPKQFELKIWLSPEEFSAFANKGVFAQFLSQNNLRLVPAAGSDKSFIHVTDDDYRIFVSKANKVKRFFEGHGLPYRQTDDRSPDLRVTTDNSHTLRLLIEKVIDAKYERLK